MGFRILGLGASGLGFRGFGVQGFQVWGLGWLGGRPRGERCGKRLFFPTDSQCFRGLEFRVLSQ